MAVYYRQSRDGYKFVPTEKGLQDSRIEAKYNIAKNPKNVIRTYEHSVPMKWLRENLVMEVKEEE